MAAETKDMCAQRVPRAPRVEDGFTLLELMVVLFVVTILIALSIPVLQGFRVRAQDRTVQVELRNAIILERGYWQEFGVYTPVASELKQLEYSFVGNDPFKPYHPLLLTDTPQRVCVTSQSDSGNWFSIVENSVTGRTYYGDVKADPCSSAYETTFSEDGW